MTARKSPFTALAVLLSALLACNVPGGQASNQQPDLAGTITAQAQALALQETPNVVLPPPPGATATFTNTPPATETPTMTLTLTPSVPMVSVSQDTNCRTGPAKIYDYVGALLIGETAEVVGKNTSEGYWIIKNPDSSGTCWLWGYYATVSGNTANLPEYDVPATPTPGIPNPPKNLEVTKVCVPIVPGVTYQLTAILQWQEQATNEDGYKVYRDGALIACLPAVTVTHSDLLAAAPGGLVFTYGVESFNSTGASARKTITTFCP